MLAENKDKNTIIIKEITYLQPTIIILPAEDNKANCNTSSPNLRSMIIDPLTTIVVESLEDHKPNNEKRLKSPYINKSLFNE